MRHREDAPCPELENVDQEFTELIGTVNRLVHGLQMQLLNIEGVILMNNPEPLDAFMKQIDAKNIVLLQKITRQFNAVRMTVAELKKTTGHPVE
jgi:hypothetical protein